MSIFENSSNASTGATTGKGMDRELVSVTGQIILSSIIGFITLFGIPANLLVIYVFSKIYKSCPTTINMMIVSITITDFMLIAYAGPVHTASYILGRWYMGNFGCQFYGFWVHFTSVASLTHLTIISLERYQVVKNNIKKDKRPFWKQLALVSIAWIYAIFWAILPFFGWSSYELEGVHTGCAPKWVSRKLIDVTYNIALIFSEFVFPLMIIIWAYWKLFQKIKEHNVSMLVANPSEQVLIRGRIILKNTTRLIILMVGAFTFSWLPYSLICIWAMLVNEKDFPPLAAAVPALFAKSSTIWNPLIYGMKHAGFREELGKIWHNLRGKSQVQPDNSNKDKKVEFTDEKEKSSSS